VYQPATAAERLVSFRSGADHLVMHTASGRVLTAGVAVVGRLGRFNKADCDFKPSEVADQERAVHLRRMLTPAEVPGLPDGVKAIGVVRLHACVAAPWHAAHIAPASCDTPGPFQHVCDNRAGGVRVGPEQLRPAGHPS
jgi:hypothetical protein